MPKLTPTQANQKWARNSVRSFLEGSKDLNWIMGTVRISGIRGQELQDIFSLLQDYGDTVRWNNAYKHCQQEGWI